MTPRLAAGARACSRFTRGCAPRLSLVGCCTCRARSRRVALTRRYCRGYWRGVLFLKRVTMEDAAAADRIITVRMGENVEQRRRYIEENAREVRNPVI